MNISKEQIKNLISLLNRVTVQGNEVEVLVQLKMLLLKELKVEPEIKKEK